MPRLQFKLIDLFAFKAVVAAITCVAAAMRHFEDGWVIVILFVFVTACLRLRSRDPKG